MNNSRLPVESLNRYVDELMRNSSSRHPAWNAEYIRKQTENTWNYVDGCMMLAFLEFYRVTGQKKFPTKIFPA